MSGCLIPDTFFHVLRLPESRFSRNETLFSYCETAVFGSRLTFAVENVKRMDITLIITVALAAAIVVVLLVLVGIIIYQRWRIGDQNVFIERFIRQNAEQREKMKKAGLL